ncbi:ion channel [Krasilnikovia cinnamomea]|uniref:Ion channel n=1 Tax=Krasilnikovia cinnamomea TaxID=349313 RepID=A0A4Q7ZLB3_9ACTN|nr:potassium channel family protein [Krasilnikovia cinnamomea]RZU51737.1 ion channel [Krasilnikovia cinnamomea]
MFKLSLVERRFAAFMRTPLSVRAAMAVIVSATVVSVLAGGILIRIVDPEEFPDVGTGLWWALQTVTTVGYGDVVPEKAVGRVVGALFMLEAIAFVAIVTAAITSSFVERARQERAAGADAQQHAEADPIAAQLADLKAQLTRIERLLEHARSTPPNS